MFTLVVDKNPGPSSMFRLVANQTSQKKANLLTSSTRLAQENYLHNDFGHGKSALEGLRATGSDREGGTYIFRISWPKILHHKIKKDFEYACDRHEDAYCPQLSYLGMNMHG